MKIHGITINFKPKFGNPAHIRILEMIGQIHAEEKLLAQKKKEAKEVRLLEGKIFSMVDTLSKEVEFANRSKLST